MRNINCKVLAACGTVMMGWGGVICAQQSGATGTESGADASQLEEIVVTAERREADLQKTAVSVDVRKGTDLTAQGRYSMAQVLEDVPGVTVNAGATSGSSDSPGSGIVIRGTPPNTAAFGNTAVPTTALYTDGVYSGVGSGYDIDRVEVLRGPQGTLYGRSATGGVVAIHTHDPELDKFDANGTVEFGSYNLEHDTAVVNVPVGDQLAVRVAGNYYSINGYPPAPEGGYSRSLDGKVKVLYKPSDDLSLLIGDAVENVYPNAGGATLSLVPPGFNGSAIPQPIADTFYPGPTESLETDNVTHNRQTWAELNWNLGPGTLTYLPTYRTFYQVQLGVGAGPGGLPLGHPSSTPSDQFITHEVRFASNPGSRVVWQVGALYYLNDLTTLSGAFINNGSNALIFSSDVTKRTLDTGVFGEATVPLADSGWRLTGGLRYDRTDVDGGESYTLASNPFGLAPGPNVITTSTLQPGQGDSTFNNVTFKARAEKDLTPNDLLYAMISTGFLPGDVQLTTVAATPPATGSVSAADRYNQEKLTAYEIGSKNLFLDRRVQINGAIFYYDYSGYQTNARSSPTITSFAVVTSPARMTGGELETVYQVTSSDRIGLSYSYTDARYVDQPSCPGAAVPCFAQLVANTAIAGIAPQTGFAYYERNFHLTGGSNLTFRADGRYSSAYDSSNLLPAWVPYEPFVRVAAQWIGDLSLGWVSGNGKYSVTGYVRNIADNAYKNSGSLEGLGTSFTSTGTRYDPRTLGVILHAGI